MNKSERKTLKKIYEDPVGPDTRLIDVEHLVMGLGGYAKWSDKHHLTVELNAKKESFYATKDKSAHLQPDDGKKVATFLSSAGITPDMSNG